MSDPAPAQHVIVNEQIDWAAVERRLERFPAIARAFPMDRLRDGSSRPPYYCHYMAWRLGTWCNEKLFTRLDELLVTAESFPNWSAEKSLLKNPEFAEYWSLVWQLQVAEYLHGIGTNVSWSASGGPDLSVEIDGEKWFVECYAYRKSFGLVHFLEDVLKRIDPSIRVSYDFCRRLSLPSNSARSAFLHKILSPLQDRAFLDVARSKCAEAYPVVLDQHDGGLVVYMEGPNPSKYLPGIVPNLTGDPERYLQVVLMEALSATKDANSLANHRPNLLVVNYALSADFQLALARADDLCLPLPTVWLGPSIDGLAIASTGIDERLSRADLRCVAAAPPAGIRRLTCVTV